MSKKNKKQNNSTPLNKYQQSRKKLSPPLATLPNFSTSSWINERLPEMMWASLIREYHKGEIGYAIFRDVMSWLGESQTEGDVKGVTHTDISKMPEKLKEDFIKHIIEVAGTDAVSPLLLLEELPDYEVWKEAMKDVELNPDTAWSQLADAVNLVFSHQSQEATDVRWVKLIGTLLSGKISFAGAMADRIEDLNYYPNRGDQRSVRPSIRSMEIIDSLQDEEYKWSQRFWGFVYENTTCIPEINQHNKDEVAKRYADVGKDKKHYADISNDVWQRTIDHFYETTKTTAVDARHEAVFGLTLYALNAFIQNNILLGASTPSGRVITRMIYEAYVTLAYLTKKESDGEQLWEAYREYGVGQISLVERKYEDEGYESAMVDLEVMDNIANEDKWSEFVPINLGNWDASNLRKISEEIGEKNLYDKYYTYTSGYIHANWGAVRESTFQTCFNPLHRLHRIPSYGLPILPNVNEDCREIINKILTIVEQHYPGLNQLIEGPHAETENNKKDEKK